MIKPPYNLRDSAILPEGSIGEAVLKHGFSSSDLQFTGWQELIEFLNHQVIAVRQTSGRNIPESIDADEIISLTPVEVLQTFLDAIETSLIPNQQFDRAENVLIAMLANESVNDEPAVRLRTARLLQTIKNKRKAATAAVKCLESRDHKFQSLRRHNKFEQVARLARVIKERRSVFALTR